MSKKPTSKSPNTAWLAGWNDGLDCLDALEAEQAQAALAGYIRHSDKTFWPHPECAVYASLSPSLVPVYVSPTPTFTEILAADAQEIAGWQADQKENLKNQVEFQEQINCLKEQLTQRTVERDSVIRMAAACSEIYGNEVQKASLQ